MANWRKKGIKIVVYLDDGFGIADNRQLCYEHAEIVKSDIIASGFVPNKDKSVWSPSQEVHWLGFIWNLVHCVLNIPHEKITGLQELAEIILFNSCKVKIRLLARFCGKIISLSPAIGNVTQIMTRSIYHVINERVDWDQHVDINNYPQCITEIVFWKNNISILSPLPLLTEKPEFFVYTDASDSGSAGYIQNSSYIMNKTWSRSEKEKSSTWREIKAIEL